MYAPVQGGYPQQSYNAAPQQPQYQQQPVAYQQQQPVVYQQQPPVAYQQQAPVMSQGYPVQQQQQQQQYYPQQGSTGSNYGNQMQYGNNYSYAPQNSVSSYAYQSPVFNGPVTLNQTTNNVVVMNNNYYGQPQQQQQQQVASPFAQSVPLGPQQQGFPMQPQQMQQQGQLSPEQQGAFLTVMGGLLTAVGGLMTLLGSMFGGQQQPGAPAGAPGAPPAGAPGAQAPGGAPAPAGQPPAADGSGGLPSAPGQQQPGGGAGQANQNQTPQDTVREAFQTFYGKPPTEQQLQRYTNRLNNQSLTERGLALELATSQEYKDKFGKGADFNQQQYAEETTRHLYQLVLGRQPEPAGFRWMANRIANGLSSGAGTRAVIAAQLKALYDSQEYKNNNS